VAFRLQCTERNLERVYPILYQREKISLSVNKFSVIADGRAFDLRLARQLAARKMFDLVIMIIIAVRIVVCGDESTSQAQQQRQTTRLRECGRRLRRCIQAPDAETR